MGDEGWNEGLKEPVPALDVFGRTLGVAAGRAVPVSFQSNSSRSAATRLLSSVSECSDS